MEQSHSVRIDKWLWAVRVFKTRSTAADACRRGQVTIGGQPAKPSRDVRVDELIAVRKDDIMRQYKVLQLLGQRVGAPKVAEYAQDLTDPAELEKLAKRSEVNFLPIMHRPKGAGRPTKKERRNLDKLSY